MKSIGFRCWDDRYAFVVLSGTQADPKLVTSGHRPVPKDMTRPQQLAWLRKDIHAVLHINQPDAGALRSMEPFAQTKSVKRAELDAIVLEGSLSHDGGLELAEVAKAQLKTRMGLKGSIDDDQWLEIFGRINSLAKCLSDQTRCSKRCCQYDFVITRHVGGLGVSPIVLAEEGGCGVQR